MKMFGVETNIRIYFQIILNRTLSMKLIISYYIHRRVVTLNVIIKWESQSFIQKRMFLS